VHDAARTLVFHEPSQYCLMARVDILAYESAKLRRGSLEGSAMLEPAGNRVNRRQNIGIEGSA
jgi:hypothetical protein